jgi:excinuclease UvrABC nuclease subunit
MDIRSYCQTDLSQLPWLPLDQRQDLPDVPAVYLVLTGDGQVLYIGKTASLQGRWKGHHRQIQFDRIGKVRLAWIEVETEEFLGEVEQLLIEHFSPVMNGQSLGDGPVVPLHFKVPEQFRREFKTYAAQRGTSMLKLLIEGFELYKQHHGK